ncbi:MAG: hypothetical protein NTW07_05075 [candidate division Zixibacteria bacterium]|nr:hypothetical protein [candidate division Zixibacteria bacterium]
MKTLSFAVLIVIAMAPGAFALQERINLPTPPGKQIQYDNPATLDSLIRPYVRMARLSYPDAKARFQKGLPSGDKFFITTRIFDPQGNFQQVFVEVYNISNGKVAGRIVTGTEKARGHTPADVFMCNEKDILDWSIAKPDGSQEGNVVGKFLEVVQERYVGLVMEIVLGRDGTVTAAKCLKALNQSEQDVSFCIPDSVMRRAEVMSRTLRYDPVDSVLTKYTFLVYDFYEGRIQEPEKGPTGK